MVKPPVKPPQDGACTLAVAFLSVKDSFREELKSGREFQDPSLNALP